MPKIEVNEKLFLNLLGKRYSKDELDSMLQVAKAELDEWNQNEGSVDERVIKIELNDTNRPDLWSTAGLVRAMAQYHQGKVFKYPFFSNEDQKQDAKERVIKVDASVQGVRPYIAGFVISGKAIDDPMLKDIIQTQEKLCWNYGRKRKSIAMGVYRAALMNFPVTYKAVDPLTTKMQPLGLDDEMNLKTILEKHPKGLEFGSILKDEKVYPFLTDSKNEVLSFPPIINSAKIGAVKTGDKDLFVEFTGTDLPSLCIAASIVACDFADSGYDILPVRVEYPFDTEFGRSITFPYYFQKPVSSELARISKFLGRNFSIEETKACLLRMGLQTESHGQFITVYPPEFRNDFLHSADIIEDVMVGYGLENFDPERPKDFTIGRLTNIEMLSRNVKDILVGLGFQEMIYNYLGSGKDYVEKMGIDKSKVIQVSNPMSENFEFVRNSPIPSLLGSETLSAKAPYPHRIFETGKVAFRAPEENYGTKTRQYLGFSVSHADANYNEAASTVNALLYFLNADYVVKESTDVRFIVGRQASILFKGEVIGVFGEVHPQVLENWGITVPTIALEMDLEAFLE